MEAVGLHPGGVLIRPGHVIEDGVGLGEKLHDLHDVPVLRHPLRDVREGERLERLGLPDRGREGRSTCWPQKSRVKNEKKALGLTMAGATAPKSMVRRKLRRVVSTGWIIQRIFIA